MFLVAASRGEGAPVNELLDERRQQEEARSQGGETRFPARTFLGLCSALFQRFKVGVFDTSSDTSTDITFFIYTQRFA